MLGNHVPLTLKKDVMRTGGIVKQIYFVKNFQGENLKLFLKLHVNIFHENISKFQIYFFRRRFLLYLSFYVKLSNIQLQMKNHICLNEHKMRNYFDTSHFGMKCISIPLRRAKHV